MISFFALTSSLFFNLLLAKEREDIRQKVLADGWEKEKLCVLDFFLKGNNKKGVVKASLNNEFTVRYNSEEYEPFVVVSGEIGAAANKGIDAENVSSNICFINPIF